MNKLSIKELIGKNNPIIFEIGCADGSDTLEFINTFDEVTIYCFEPEPKNINLIKQKIKYDRFFLYEGVVSDKNEKLLFNRSRIEDPAALSLSGSIKKPKNHLKYWPEIKFDEQIIVDSVTLDTFCEQKQIKIIDFLWADVQGAEENVILGGTNTLKNSVKYFYTEYSNIEHYENQINLNEILKLLGNNWAIIKNFGNDVLLKNMNMENDLKCW